jgi:hypothetical protein
LVSLAAVAALGGGLWWFNVSQEGDTASPPAPIARSTFIQAPAAPRPSTPPPVSFPARANYVAEIPTRSGVIALDIGVDGGAAVAYACDGQGIETWLKGNATAGGLSLASQDGTGRLVGRLTGSSVAGTLWIGEKKWGFRATGAGGDDGVA